MKGLKTVAIGIVILAGLSGLILFIYVFYNKSDHASKPKYEVKDHLDRYTLDSLYNELINDTLKIKAYNGDSTIALFKSQYSDRSIIIETLHPGDLIAILEDDEEVEDNMVKVAHNNRVGFIHYYFIPQFKKVADNDSEIHLSR